MVSSVDGMQQITRVMPLVAGPFCCTRASSPCHPALWGMCCMHDVSVKIPAPTLHVGDMYGGRPRTGDAQHVRPSRESIEPRRTHQGLDSPNSRDVNFQA
jgi:hypothetical protein